MPIENRLFGSAKVNEHGCWIWLRGKIGTGYGLINYGVRRVLAHRLAYELCVGKIPSGLEVMHDCDTPACINPAHLRLGTHRDNVKDAVSKGRHCHGESRPNSKVTVEQVKEIRALAKQGMLQREVGKLFGIERRHVGLIVERRTWKDVK